MKRIIFAAAITALHDRHDNGAGNVLRKAVGKNGKPLAGAALNSFLKKMQTRGMLAEGGELGRQETFWCGQEQFHAEMCEGRLIR